jgi:histidine triad (HIT) family protein
MRGLRADGVTIMQSNGAAAWQTVFHYHVHVIPRYDGDPLVLPWRPGSAPADPDELADISRSYFSD